MNRQRSADQLFEFHKGLHLKSSVLWFDAPTPHQLCFISHANIASALSHQKILATMETNELLRTMGSAHGRGRRLDEPQALVSPYGRPFSLGQLSLELFPSGHILGSSSLLVKHQGLSIVYAGHVNPRSSPLAQRLEARTCDVLVLTGQFGQRRFVFPPLEQTAESLIRFTRDTLERNLIPVFFCSPLGEAQEVAHLLIQAGIRCRAHRQIFSACKAYSSIGFPLDVRSFPPVNAEALLWPISLHTSPSLNKISGIRTAFVSGMALDDASREEMSCDASFAISTHSDYPGLLEYVKVCEPNHVLIPPGANVELQDDLKALGMEVTSIGPPQQMDLF
jgi:putative mRNA 3-end processing factor